MTGKLLAFRSDPGPRLRTWQFGKDEGWPGGLELSMEGSEGRLMLDGRSYDVVAAEPIYKPGAKLRTDLTAIGYTFSICHARRPGHELVSCWEMGLKRVGLQVVVVEGERVTRVTPWHWARSLDELTSSRAGQLFFDYFGSLVSA